jgi:hypothetical protein
MTGFWGGASTWLAAGVFSHHVLIWLRKKQLSDFSSSKGTNSIVKAPPPS